jgi:hypothetical protein
MSKRWKSVQFVGIFQSIMKIITNTEKEITYRIIKNDKEHFHLDSFFYSLLFLYFSYVYIFILE